MKKTDMKQKGKTFLLVLLFVFLQLSPIHFAGAETISSSSLKKGYSFSELDQMLAPVALYPDALLLQILKASRFPQEVARAADWVEQQMALNGKSVKNSNASKWNSSIRSLLAFPDILITMSSRIDWTTKLGDAFGLQQEKVLDRIQFLRRKAKAVGHLKSNEWINVETVNHQIIIEPFSSEMIHVPYYNPHMIYGSWWWPEQEPYYWSPWHGYGNFPHYVSEVFLWGAGIQFRYPHFHGHIDWKKRKIHWDLPPKYPAVIHK